MRMLSRPAPSSAKSSNQNAAASNSLSSSPSSFPPSVPLSSSSSPRSLPPSPIPEPAVLNRPLSSLPLFPASTSVGSSSLHTTPSAHPSASSSVSTGFSQGFGSTGLTSANHSSPGTTGVVVVGVIGRYGHETSMLLDRLLDSNVFGVRSRVWEQWQESINEGSPSSNVVGSTIMERKQSKDGHRFGDSSSHLGGVIEGDGRIDDNVRNDFGSNRGTRSDKGHAGNGRFGRRREGKDAKNEKAGGASGDTDMKRNVLVENTDGDAVDEESGKIGDGCMEASRSVPVFLRKLKHHHDEEKGMLYVQFTWGELSLNSHEVHAADGLSSFLEQEADVMRGLLFMFSVCHVILLVQEGARFDTRLLRVLRLLQAAKHSLMPFVKTKVLPGLLPPPSSANKPSLLKPISLATGHTPSRSGMPGRNSSTIALMSGSTPVLFPGQCTPVLLFVCLEDLGEATVGLSTPSRTRSVDSSDVSTSSQVGSLLSRPGNYLPHHALHVKPMSSGSTATVINKSESGLRKKLQSSVEAQIRFLLKKCRTVAGSGDTGTVGSVVGPGMGLRGQGNSGNIFQGVGGGDALFVLDPSRAVILLDRSAVWQTDSLDYAVDGIEAMLSGKQDLEDVLWNTGSNADISGEDVQAVKDFLWRQAEMLRGKGGISSNSAGGAAGVGMVAAAAAAAAASAASGGSGGTSKATSNPPELPTFSGWLSASTVLAEALSAKVVEGSGGDALHKISHGSHIASKKRAVGPMTLSGNTGSVMKTGGTIDSTILCLESGSDVDMKFSAAWCKRVLEIAQDTYLMGLPPSYSTSCHISQLEKSLRVFHSLVRGPAVPLYTEKLKNDCEAIWHCGRQLCDAESLTGKPCIHRVHNDTDVVTTNLTKSRRDDDGQNNNKESCEKHISKPHSSGVVFLHACACGRSRKLRKDPFDFESANVTFFRFPHCENLLPSLITPNPSEGLPSGGSPWSLVCLGNSHYYQPAVGLIQSGFCSKQNFLSFWDIPIVYRTVEPQGRSGLDSTKEEGAELIPSLKGLTSLDTQIAAKFYLSRALPEFETKPASVDLHTKAVKKGFSNDVGTPIIRRNFKISKSWSGTTDFTIRSNYSCESAFPPLPQKMYKPAEQSTGKHGDRDPNELVNSAVENRHVQSGNERDTEGYHLSNVKDLDNVGSNKSLNSMTEHTRVYIGFEHECPHGHRYLLSHNEPEKPGASYSSLGAGVGKQQSSNSVWPSKRKKQDQNGLHNRDAASLTRTQDSNPFVQEKWEKSSELSSKPAQKGSRIASEGRGGGHSLLNSNLPIYMHCPYCKMSNDDKERSSNGVVFGGTISQLQRIFLVTPSSPLLLASCPVVEFEGTESPGRTTMEFNRGREVVLPADSFLSLRLPFVYYSQREEAPHKPLLVEQKQPEHFAWLVKNTAIYVKSNGGRSRPSGG